ncbi:MCL1 domain-containing protein [Plasmodium brasilianum]|uniref:WDHD1/CFT4 second beta-propeller domain-containing protein n=2 Tax=Plasmodium (Plasmodium) TaxID=418103 RepID=A0A1D3TDX9_PLAMA|nr:conserved Plasmodium protein, unknown function [Plasmodium malariae]KAI4834623.1 MCL1 domain-containing protein [Plasmodium brasilianum]SCP03163.1 conserved Plasmodium protein, unknown function [Plasmodium malariae]
MKDLYFADINSTLFLRHYNNKLLLISGNRIKLYTYEEIKNIIRAQNIAIYIVKDIEKNEKIVYISNNVIIKRHLRSNKEKSITDDVHSFNNDVSKVNYDKNGNNGHNNEKISDGMNSNMNNNVINNLSIKDDSSNNAETNYVCIAFEQGNVWLCAEDGANKMFVYEKLIYRKICDIIKIEIFTTNNVINSLILYKDYTLIFYNEKLQNSVKIPIQEYVYNFCLSNNNQNIALFNHKNLYIYDIMKKNFSVEDNEEIETNENLQVSNNDKNCIEVKDIFDFSKNYKNLLSCDWHPQNLCIALCGKNIVRYLVLYNYKVYEYSGTEMHKSYITATKFITISDNVILLTSLSCGDNLFCVWEFELEYCLYKFKSDHIISHFDLSYFDDYLHMSFLAEEKHLANEKLDSKKIIKKIEWDDSEDDTYTERSICDPVYPDQTDKIHTGTNKMQGIDNGTDSFKDNYNGDKNKKDNNSNSNSSNNNNNAHSSSTYENEKDRISSEYFSGSNGKRNSESCSGECNLNYLNKKKRKKKIFVDDEENQDNFINLSHKKMAKDRDLGRENKREDKHDQYYERKKIDKMNFIDNYAEEDPDDVYNSYESDKYRIHSKKHLTNKKNREDNEYNKKEYNIQNFINKNKDVIMNNRESGYFEDNSYLFDNDDDQKSVTAFNSYIKEKFEQLEKLKKQVDMLQKQVKSFTKINLDDFIVLCPGLCEEPENINDQWCMFWNDIGHITKKKEGNKTYIYIFLFRGEDVGKKKITDIYNVTSASLSAYGFALASNPYEKTISKSNSILCFHNLKDNVIWNKYLPSEELIKGVANGNNFVAIVTSNNFLRIYSAYGYIINTFLLKGIPVALCAYDYLLFVITCPYIFENVYSYNINNTYNCTLYKVYENFTDLKPSKYNTYHITILYDDVLSLPSCHYLNWVNISNFGIPYVRDTSNFIYGLYPVFKKNNNIVYDWVPIFDLNNLNTYNQMDKSKYQHAEQQNGNTLNKNEQVANKKIHNDLYDEDEKIENNKDDAKKNRDSHPDDEMGTNSQCVYYPLYFDNFEQISVIRLKKNEIEPRSNKIESCLGYNVEKKYIVMSECNVMKYEKLVKLLQANPNLSLDNDSNKNESATLLPWEQYDEMRSRVDLYCKQLFVNISYDYMNDGKNKSAVDTLKSLNKLYDKWIMRMFAILKNDKKNQKLAVKVSRLFKNIKNMMLSLSLVDDEYSTLHSEITNEYLKRQIKDENYKNYKQNHTYEEDYKDDEQKRKEMYDKYYKNNQNISEDEKKIFSDTKQTGYLYKNSTKDQVENDKEKKENHFLDKFFTGVTKNQSVDNLFSQEKKISQIKKKSTLENFFSELKEE